MRQAPQLYYAAVLGEIERGERAWMYADHPIYSFHTGIRSQLGVLPLKRFWAGEMTNERLTAGVSASREEIILLANDGREVPFEELLQRGIIGWFTWTGRTGCTGGGEVLRGRKMEAKR